MKTRSGQKDLGVEEFQLKLPRGFRLQRGGGEIPFKSITPSPFKVFSLKGFFTKQFLSFQSLICPVCPHLPCLTCIWYFSPGVVTKRLPKLPF